VSDIPLWLSIVVKVMFAATVVVSATLLAEKSGPLVAGLIIAMPISVGPTYVMLALTKAPSFIADSALGSIAANAAVAAFGTVYVLLARRVPNRSLADRSTTSITVISRSSVNFFTNASPRLSPRRAVTFQSIDRTSSPG
jgi:hypothetical protein